MNANFNQEKVSIDDEFGERLRQLRKNLGMVQEAFAKSLDVSLATITRLERGHFKPSAEFLAKLALTYQCDVGWLLTGRELASAGSAAARKSLICDPHIHDQLKAQRDGLQEVLDQAADDGHWESQSAKRLREKVDYLDALLKVGCEPRL